MSGLSQIAIVYVSGMSVMAAYAVFKRRAWTFTWGEVFAVALAWPFTVIYWFAAAIVSAAFKWERNKS